ncbi:MAG: hypothetical protein WA747_02350 [Steroidobacteraceae bacterium]
MPALLYGFFACYAVTGKCDLRTDTEGHAITVFASLEDCQRFGSASARQPPNAEGRWLIDESHYYKCFGLTPMPVAALPSPPGTPRPVYNTTADALQRDFAADPDALKQKIGNAIVEVSGTVTNPPSGRAAALQLSAPRWDVTAWLTPDAITPASKISKREHVTLRCDRIGTLVAASARRPAAVEVRDCKLVSAGG